MSTGKRKKDISIDLRAPTPPTLFDVDDASNSFFSPGVQEKRRNQSDACKVKVESWRLSSGCIGEFRIFVGLFSSHTKPKGKRERETTCFCVSPSATFSIMTSLLLEFFRENFFSSLSKQLLYTDKVFCDK